MPSLSGAIFSEPVNPCQTSVVWLCSQNVTEVPFKLSVEFDAVTLCQCELHGLPKNCCFLRVLQCHFLIMFYCGSTHACHAQLFLLLCISFIKDKHKKLQSNICSILLSKIQVIPRYNNFVRPDNIRIGILRGCRNLMFHISGWDAPILILEVGMKSACNDQFSESNVGASRPG